MPRGKIPSLVVKLPYLHKLRSASVPTAAPSSKGDNKKAKTPAAERMRKYRARMKNNPKKYDLMRERKKEQNRQYKSNIRERRASDAQFNQNMKNAQVAWQRKSRSRTRKSTTNTVKSSTIPYSLTASAESPPSLPPSPNKATTRKRAERLKQTVGYSPKSLGATLAHIVNTATPKSKQQFTKSLKLTNTSTDTSTNKALNSVITSVYPSKSGRPTTTQSLVRKTLFNVTEVAALIPKSTKKRFKKQGSQGKVQCKKSKWKPQLQAFFDRDDVARTMPNKRDVVIVKGEKVAKRHLLQSKGKTYKMFKKEHPDYPYHLTTFLKEMPKNIRRLRMMNRRVCVCLTDTNLEKKIGAINRAATQAGLPQLHTTLRDLSSASMCPHPETRFPKPGCVNRQCTICGTKLIKEKYQVLIDTVHQDVSKVPKPRWYIWQHVKDDYVNKEGKTIKNKSWQQVQQSDTVEGLVQQIVDDLESFSGHMFRSDFQYFQEMQLQSILPLDHAMVRADFSENMSLQFQDEIESAHWSQKQVTVHPVYLVRHSKDSTLEKPILQKESLVMVSDSLSHNACAVFKFMNKVISVIQNNPGPEPIKVLHRFTDNCACQYKCIVAFSHMPLYKEIHGIDVRYHYCEPGHGKGPSDGIGATFKQKIASIILGEKAVIRNAYEACLYGSRALNKMAADDTRTSRLLQFQQSHRQVIYVPGKSIKKSSPPPVKYKSIPGTHGFRSIQMAGEMMMSASNLSCTCVVCIGVQEGPCYFAQYRSSKIYPIQLQQSTADATCPVGDPVGGLDDGTTSDVQKTVEPTLDTVTQMDTDQDMLGTSLNTGDYVAVKINSRRFCNIYMAQIVEMDESDMNLRYMKKAGNVYIWPDKEDTSWEEIESIIGKVASPEMINSRKHYKFGEMDIANIKSKLTAKSMSFK